METKEKIQKRRAVAAAADKAAAIKSEKERRERGQKMEEVQVERDRMQRRREMDKLKREKQDATKERERLRAQIAADKEARRANKGMLPSVLGVDGYNPSIGVDKKTQLAAAAAAAEASASGAVGAAPSTADDGADAAAAAAAAPPIKAAVSSAELAAASAAAATATAAAGPPGPRVDQALSTILRYRTGGDGGAALKLLLTMVRNVADKPNEAKYRSINSEGNAFKTKLAHLVGPANMLRALGFYKTDDGYFRLDDGFDQALASETKGKLEAAMATWQQQNP
jgi:hypothetical protein